jgi:beta-lactamase regulating signal transducer with metallopeptidase domain
VNIAVYLPLLAAVAVGLGAPAAVHLARPAAGAFLLAALAVVTAAGSTWALVLLATTLIDDVRPGPEAPVPDGVAAAAAALVALAVIRVVIARLRRFRASHGVHSLLPADAPIVVVADDRPDAFAIPPRWHPRAARRRAGRIVVTDAMIRTLDDRQRQAMFAHERAHLDGGHHLLRAAAALAAALNPVLIPACRTVAYLCERAADERAAIDVGDRGVVASAVATAALARSMPDPGRSGRALAFDDLGVVDRVAALGRPAPRRRQLVAAGAALLAVAIVVADAHATVECVTIIRALLPG